MSVCKYICTLGWEWGWEACYPLFKKCFFFVFLNYGEGGLAQTPLNSISVTIHDNYGHFLKPLSPSISNLLMKTYESLVRLCATIYLLTSTQHGDGCEADIGGKVENYIQIPNKVPYILLLKAVNKEDEMCTSSCLVSVASLLKVPNNKPATGFPPKVVSSILMCTKFATHFVKHISGKEGRGIN